MYLPFIMGWSSRRVLALGISNRLETEVWLVALGEALTRSGVLEIFKTDHCAKFTREAITMVLKTPGIAIGMDGKGVWVDNVLHQVKLEFFRSGKPTDNAYIESFNGTLWKECLNTLWFFVPDRCTTAIYTFGGWRTMRMGLTGPWKIRHRRDSPGPMWKRTRSKR